MRQDGPCGRRSLQLLCVVVLHGLLIEALLRQSKELRFPVKDSSPPLTVFFIPRSLPSLDHAPAAKRPDHLPSIRSLLDGKALSVAPPGPLIIPSPGPSTPPVGIDWQHELELEARNGVTDQEREKSYRDLSASLTSAQRDWLKRNHMQPATPGITWKSPRIEVLPDGMPIVHINDHCVIMPLFLMPMILCSIGHIEPKGDLFNHMRDPRQP